MHTQRYTCFLIPALRVEEVILPSGEGKQYYTRPIKLSSLEIINTLHIYFMTLITEFEGCTEF